MPATAITQALHELYPHKHVVTVVNMGDESNFFLEDFLHAFYLMIFKHTPWLLKVYKISDSRFFMRSVNKVYYKLNRRDILKLYDRIRPDLVLSNYPAWDYSFYKTLKKYHPGVPYVNLNTDSSYPHYAWLIADADYNIVADEDTKALYVKRGKNSSKIKVLGIPIRQDVATLSQKSRLSKSPPKMPYKILYITSDSRVKTILRLLEEFAGNNDFKIEVVLGRSKVSKNQIMSRLHANNIKITGWTNEIARKLSQSHIVITKPGGSTTQECIAMKKPMIINKVVPGQEQGNASLIMKHRIGFVTTDPKSIVKDCYKIIRNYPGYQKRLAELSKGNSAKQVASFLDSIET